MYVPFALISGALLFVPRGPVFWGMVGLGVAAFVAFPLVIQGLLVPIERRVIGASRREATEVLREIRQRRLVRLFAPFAWTTLQEARLHLRRGDGKAAVRAFAETARLGSRPSGAEAAKVDPPALVSMQAHALLIADQPEQARELLQALAKRQELAPIDRLHLGLALQAGKGHNREALEHIESAAATLGRHPRAQVGLALALYRVDRTDEAMAALEAARAALGAEPDVFDEGLVERATKLMRTVQKAQQKRVRRQDERVDGDSVKVNEVAAPAGQDKAAKGKSARKAKKDERRAARRAAKANPDKGQQAKGKKGKVAQPQQQGAKGSQQGKVVAAGSGVGVKAAAAPVKVETVAKAAATPVKVETVAKAAAAPVIVAKAAATPVKVETVAKVAAEPVKSELVAKVAAEPVKSELVAKVATEPVVKVAAEQPVVKVAAEPVVPVKVAAEQPVVKVATEPVKSELVAPVKSAETVVKVAAEPVAPVKAAETVTKVAAESVKADPVVPVRAAEVVAKVEPVVAVKAEPVVLKKVETSAPARASEELDSVDVVEAVSSVRSVEPASMAPVRPASVPPPIRPAAAPGSLAPTPGAAPRLPAPPSGSSLFGSLGAKPPVTAKPLGSGPSPALLGGPPVLGGNLPPPPRLGPPPAIPPPPRVGPPPPVAAPVIPGAPATSDDSWAAMLDAPTPPTSPPTR